MTAHRAVVFPHKWSDTSPFFAYVCLSLDNLIQLSGCKILNFVVSSYCSPILKISSDFVLPVTHLLLSSLSYHTSKFVLYSILSMASHVGTGIRRGQESSRFNAVTLVGRILGLTLYLHN